MIFQTQICGDIEVKMNKKNFMDMMICSLSAAIIILCFTYMEQSRGRDTLMAVCGIVFSGIFAAGSDGFSVRQTEKKRKWAGNTGTVAVR